MDNTLPQPKQRQYLIIDLKSFFASVECADRGLDPMTTLLVVADKDRSKSTICLAITPAMKALGIKNRCRMHEIPQHLNYIVAPPRMKRYIDVSADIYGIYLNYISKDDIHVYSIDESFLDVTSYLELYGLSAHDLALKLMNDILKKLGLRATCGIGTNMYLAKVALDLLAKHSPDFIAELTEESFTQRLWSHRPLTDFWRIGPGTQRRLNSLGLYTQGDIAACPEKILYKNFGVLAEYLIDHSWGREPCTIADIKNYQKRSQSLTCGQVLMRDYNFEDALIIIKEMSDELSLDMVAEHVVSNSISLYIGYTANTVPSTRTGCTLQVTTNSSRILMDAFVKLYYQCAIRTVPIRRIILSANSILDECFEQYSFFVDPTIMEKDRKILQSVNKIKARYGKNAIFKGMDLLESANALQRNNQIGGHKAGF
ncbi:Y-family DNA polymerase [Butyrivibrio sp. YAB3001]|uniref:Y-family DNA polymerase n=1 Tax=Butyrivibrio sp. YAB3001 TaxID=1520812 RepID=UPI0008F6854D|nr:DNA repair protein [Butyrivibrio sp. YAB3001]SFB99110.1 DNA polymerase V [Butyrivibrio sp. YAB3001]